MEMNQEFFSLLKYPIDDYPIDINDFIKPYEEGLIEIEGDNLCFLLTWGLKFYNYFIYDTSRFSVNPKIVKFEIDLLGNTGYAPDSFIPNEQISKKLFDAPEIAVTDLDKALLGWIISEARALTFDYNPKKHNLKERLFSAVCFFHNAQRFEQKTHRTIEISLDIIDENEPYLHEIFTDPSFVAFDSDFIILSDNDVKCLSDILSYRDELNRLIEETRNEENQYILNEQNNSDWDLYISCLNYRAYEEKRVTDLINSDIPIEQKLFEFNKYFEEIHDIPKSFNPTIKLSELTNRIIKRAEFAPNYLWVRAGESIAYLDDTIISSVSSPYSFNCVLIAYHAFLLKTTTENIARLVFLLNMFIRKNIGQKFVSRKNYDDLSSLEEDLISISDEIRGFYDAHQETINLIKYDSIQEEEAFYGLSYDQDIWKCVFFKEQKMNKENINAIASIDDEKQKELKYRLAELVAYEAPDEEFRSLYNDCKTQLPNKLDNENKLFEYETANRLIVSINAIYVLVKTMDRLLEKGLIREEYKYSIINSSKLLSKLERYLVKTTYVAPGFNCFDDIDMDEYRERKGIDASAIELKNNERIEMTLFDSARRSIRIIHEEIHGLDYEKALKIKNDLRDEIKDLPDSQLKEFIIDLIDQECQALCNSLIETNSKTADFNAKKKQIYDEIGPSINRLPTGTINALTTAELLFSQYVVSETVSSDFDFSGISALYYQAVETMYNELIWTKYAAFLNIKKENKVEFKNLYSNGEKLPAAFQGYLPNSIGKYSENGRIKSTLPFGSFIFILKNITSQPVQNMRGFRVHVDRIFGYNSEPTNTEEYMLYQKNIDEFHKQLKFAHPRRNKASHGEQPITLEECKEDRKIVFSDIERIRNDYLGLIRIFLSLYKSED